MNNLSQEGFTDVTPVLDKEDLDSLLDKPVPEPQASTSKGESETTYFFNVAGTLMHYSTRRYNIKWEVAFDIPGIRFTSKEHGTRYWLPTSILVQVVDVGTEEE